MTEIDDTSSPAGEEPWQQVGAEMRRRREAKKTSLSEFATWMSLTPDYVGKIETGIVRTTPEIARRADEVLQTGGALAERLAGLQSSPQVDDEPDLTGDGGEDCPYPGVAAFSTQQAPWFFGREAAIDELIRGLEGRLDGNGPLAVVAPSGAGKSSLLAAGLIPALRQGRLPCSTTWTVVMTTPGADPLATLAAEVARQTGADPSDATAATTTPLKFADFLANIVNGNGGKRGEKSSSARIMIIVDEFEKVFIERHNDDEQREFVAGLCAAAYRPEILIVLGVRADFYGHCLTFPGLDSALQDVVKLVPMSRDQLREIITRPAQTKGRQVDSDLVERLLSDLRVIDSSDAGTAVYDPGALAWLAHALRATWQHSSEPQLTVADYHRSGSMHAAIATTAEHVYTELSAHEQWIAHQLLLHLVWVGTQSRDARRSVLRNDLLRDLPGLAEEAVEVVETFGRKRLLTFGTHGDADKVAITHEALLRSWPRLAGWISTDGQWLHIRQSLFEAAKAWGSERQNQSPYLLYRNSRLAEAQKWTANPQYMKRLNELERDFLQASSAQMKREKRRNDWRRRLVVYSLVFVTLFVGIFVVYEHNTLRAQRDVAATQKRLAIANRLVATSRSLAVKQPDAAMLLAVEAFHLSQAPEARGALLSAQDQFFVGQLVGHIDGTVHTTMFNHDGRSMVTAGDDGTAWLWDVTNHRPLFPLEGHGHAIYDAEFSPDDSIVATAGKDGTVRLWNVNSHGQTYPPLTTTGGGTDRDLYAATFSHNGHILATAGKDGIARLWDMDSHRQIAPLPGHIGPVLGATFSLDDSILATAGADGTARLWNVSSRRQIALLSGHIGRVNNAAFSPTGNILATVGDDTTTRLWDIASHQQVAILPGHTGRVNATAFSPNGHILVTGSDDKTARLWNVDTHQQIGAFTGTSAITGVAFSRDGHTVATAGDDAIAKLWDTGGPILIPSPPAIGYDVVFILDGLMMATSGEDGTVRLWDTANRHEIDPLKGHSGAVYAMAFSPDGNILATAGADGTARLWNPVTHQLIWRFGDHPGAVRGVAFNRDGSALVTVGDNATVRLWDAATHQPAGSPLTGHTGTVHAAAFSPDGRTLATAGDDAIRLWDAATHQPVGLPLTGFPGTINKVAFSPDSRILATVGDDFIARLWDTASHQLIAALTGHTGKVETVAFSRDGHTLVTASSDGTAKLWSTDNHQLLATLTGHTDVVYGAAFSPDGAPTLATSGADRTVRIWDLDVNRVTDRICHIIGTVSPTQWAQLIPELPYQPTCH